MPPLRWLLRAAAVLIPLGVAANVGFTLATSDRALLASLGDVPMVSIALVVGLSAVPWFTQSARIVIWTRFVGHPLRYLSALRIYAGGVLGSAVTPTAVGGGSIRWALATRRGVPGGVAASLFSVEGIEDLVFFAVALPLALHLSSVDETEAFQRASDQLALGIDGTILALLISVLALGLLGYGLWREVALGRVYSRQRRRALRVGVRVQRSVRRGFDEFKRAIALIAARGKTRFAVTLSLTAIQWTARYSVATVILLALGDAFRPFLYWILGWMTYALSSPVPTPGAVGASEASFVLLHAPFVSAAILGLTAAVWRFVLFYLPAIVAVIVYPLASRADAPGTSAD